MGGFFSTEKRSLNSANDTNPTLGPYALRKIQCTLQKWACFKLADGTIDRRYHPFLEKDGSIRKDTVQPTFLQRGGVPLWWWKIVLFIGVSIGLSFVQSAGDVPRPFNSLIFNLTGMFIFGAYFFARITFLFTRNFQAGQFAYAARDGAVSISQHMASLFTPEELKKMPDLEIDYVRWDVETCSTFLETVPAVDLYCEAAYIAANLGYAMVFSFRKQGVIAAKLPMHEASRKELAYRVAQNNKDHIGVMLQMLEERLMALVGAKVYRRPLRELTQQVDALNSIFAKLDEINALVPGRLVNGFLMFWLYVWLAFLVWIFPFSQGINIFLAALVQILAIGTLSFLTAEGSPFDNTETNPYSTIPIQNLKHIIGVEALGASLSALDRINAYRSFKAPAKSQPVASHIDETPDTNLLQLRNQSTRRAVDGYNNTYFA